MDRHVAHVAHKVGPAQLDRLVEEAIGRFMPEEAERRRRQAADGRSFTVDTRQPSLRGTSPVYGELDLADALDLDAAVAAGAQALKDLGSTDTLDVRRATAVGDLARRQLTLDLNTTPDGAQTGEDATDDDESPAQRVGTATVTATPTAAATTGAGAAQRKVRKPRQVVLYVHLSDAAVVPGAPLAGEFGRVENTRGPVHAEQIRQWCGNPDAQITVQPVHRPERAHRRRGLRDPRPAAGTDHPDPPHLRVPLVHPTRPRPRTRRARRRLRPPGPLREGPAQLLLQRRPALPPASPGQDPRPAGPTPPSNAAPTCGPAPTATSTSATTTAPSTCPATGTPHPPDPCTHPPGRLTPPPRTPPDHHRRGPRHVRTRSGQGHDRRDRPHGRDGPRPSLHRAAPSSRVCGLR